MLAAEVISIEDSPVRPVSGTNSTRCTQVLAAVDASFSSDEDLPELPVIRSVHGSSLTGRHSAPLLGRPQSFHSRIDTQSEDKELDALQTSSTTSEAVILLDSESDMELDILPPVAQSTSHSVPLAKPSLQKSNTLPVAFPEDTTKPSAVLPNLSSNILLNIEKLLARTETSEKAKQTKPHKRRAIDDVASADGTTTDGDDESQNVSQSKKVSTKGSSKRTNTANTKAAKLAERELARQKKAQEKEAKLIEKRKAQSIAAVNTLKRSKKDSTNEMMVDICDSIKHSAFETHITSFMGNLGCPLRLRQMPVPGLIRFRRQVKARYDTEKGYWMPLENPTVEHEDQLIVYMKAQDYVLLAASEIALSEHVSRVREVRPTAKVLYLIEGLTALLRKSRTAKNRAYQAVVRSMAGEPAEPVGNSRSRTGPAPDLDEDAVEDTLLDLQIQHNCLIVHSTSPADSAEQLSVLVSDLSTVPYKVERENMSIAFCTEVGQIKTGSDNRDTFEKMLQSITRVTPQISQAIAARYSGIRELCEALTAGPHILNSIPKGHNVDGTVTGQMLGSATSLKIHRVLTSMDAHADA